MKSILIYMLLFLPLFICAQEDNIFKMPKFQKIDLKDGLTNLNTSSIIQDDMGYIWIATARGLNRYDGTSFEHFLFTDDENGLYSNMVHKLHKNFDGNIFCSTRGINMFDVNKGKMLRLENRDGNFLDFIDFEGETYGTSTLSGLCKYKPAEKKFEKITKIKNDIIFNHLSTDSTTGIWGKSTNNLHIVNYNPFTEKFNNYPIPSSTSEKIYSSMIKIDSLLFIIGNNNYIFNINTLEYSTYPEYWNKLEELNNLEILSAKKVNKSTLWIATRTKGLFVFDMNKNTLTNFNKSNSTISSNFINCIFTDKDKNIWLGTFDNGVSVAFNNCNNVNFDNILNKLTNNNFINSITSDYKNNYYIGTRYKGLYIYNSKSRNHKHLHSGNSFLNSNHIRTIHIDTRNQLWVADQEALHIINQEHKSTNEFSISGQNEGFGHFSEYNGKIFASSDYQGFFIFNINGKLLKQELKLGSNISQTIPINNQEIIVATFENGIYKYNIVSGKYNNIYTPNGSGENTNNLSITMHLDKDSILWIGNYVTGLHCLNLRNKKSKIYNTKHGLSNNDIVGIVEDKSDNLWLSTSYGISMFDKKHDFVNYFYNDGLNNLQFHAKSVHKDKNGILYFGGNNGLSYLNPKVLSESINKKSPDIILKNLQVKNKEVIPNDETGILSTIINNTSEIKLKHKQNVITIEYHAFDYVAANEVKYSYFLEGLDNQWNNVNKRTYANFSNLKAGEYTFHVKAQNNRGIWSDTISLKIIVAPLPLLSIWAFIIYFIIITIIIYTSFYLIIRAKLLKKELEFEQNERNRENEISKMKIRFFTNISHEIRTPLTLIKGNLDLLSHELNPTNNKYTNIKINGIKYGTNRLIALTNQILSLRKLDNDTLDLKVLKKDIIEVTESLIQPHSYLAANKKIDVNIETQLDTLYIPVDEDKFDKIISNLLSNSLKHSHKSGFVKIKIEMLDNNEVHNFFPNNKAIVDNSYVKISVIDNGSGIQDKDLPYIFDRYRQSSSDAKKPDYSGIGIGLNFTKRLVKLHKGAITVESEPDISTCFTFILPATENAYSEKEWGTNQTFPKNEINDKSIIKPFDEVIKDRNEVILIIEDDLELNTFLTSLFESQYKIISAHNGKEGLLLTRNHLPSLIISDIMMPEINGYELCEKIREDEMISHIPILLLTAKTDAKSRIEGYNYGADEYISKPFDLDILVARVKNLIDQRKKLKKSFKMGIIDEHTDLIENPFEFNFIKRIESILAEKYNSPELNVNTLANLMNMSRASFYRKFMNLLDISPKEFITKYRINKSIELIKQGNDNFGDISLQCGFSSQSAFTIIFKKEKGITPMQYKQSL